jgi:hypothetical protein
MDAKLVCQTVGVALISLCGLGYRVRVRRAALGVDDHGAVHGSAVEVAVPSSSEKMIL